jgi:N-acetylneuraminic acid mutarotase
LIVAGGANFPEKMPWEGGQKVWHDSIFVLPKDDGQWLSGFRLPRPAAYGVSLTISGGVLCAGGSDAREHFREVFLLSWVGGKIKIKSLAPLPRPMANGCGALLGRTVYLAGGTQTPEATNALKVFWALDLSEPQPRWQELQPWPGPARMLAVAAAQDGAFFLVSGVDLSGDADGKPVRRYLRDAYRYQPGAGWTRIADLPWPAVAAPSPAPTLDLTTFLILGGDDGSKVGFQPPREHPGFGKTILAYDIATDSWKTLGEMPVARVTTTTVKWNDGWVVPSGETRPGVRSPEVWAVHPESR